MCDKRAYRAQLLKRHVHIIPDTGFHSARHAEEYPVDDNRHRVSMGSFTSARSIGNADGRPGKLPVRESDILSRQGLLPMHSDDRKALLAWVQAKQQEMELKGTAMI